MKQIKHSAYILVFAVFGFSTLLWLGQTYLAQYQRKMDLLQQFERHQEAALVYQIARPIYEKEQRPEIKTNLGQASFYRQSEFVYCTVKLSKVTYHEKFQYVIPDTVHSN